MSRVVIPREKEVNWDRCPNKHCGADFDIDPNEFVVSGDGDWSRTIVCLRCMHVRESVPVKVLAEMLSHKWGDKFPAITTTLAEKYIYQREAEWEKRVQETTGAGELSDLF
jgi:hypothetical protein